MGILTAIIYDNKSVNDIFDPILISGQGPFTIVQDNVSPAWHCDKNCNVIPQKEHDTKFWNYVSYMEEI